MLILLLAVETSSEPNLHEGGATLSPQFEAVSCYRYRQPLASTCRMVIMTSGTLQWAQHFGCWCYHLNRFLLCTTKKIRPPIPSVGWWT